MAFNDVIPQCMIDDMLKDFQPSLPLHTPRYRIKDEYVCSVPDSIVCELTPTGTNWSSSGVTDHPSFTRLRNHLEAKGLIETQRSWSNGDRVLEEFYLNDVLFKAGDTFFCAAAMSHTLKSAEKHPMKKEEPKMPEFDAKLHEWEIYKGYQGGLFVSGKVYNDSKGRFNDGDRIRTSQIIGVEGDIIITKNTRYKLV